MKLRMIFASALMLFSLISSPSMIAASSEQSGGTNRKFVIYYGWYSDGEGRLGHEIDRIVRSNPEYVVSPYFTSAGTVNLTPAVFAKFTQNGISVLAYIATGNAARQLDIVLAEIRTGLEAGAAGVMLDEVATLQSEWQLFYYQRIYDYVKSFGADRLVVANPGSILVSETVMSVSDIVCFEHQWRLAPALDWFSKYPAERFMGISSNDIAGVMGYTIDGEVALRDTIEAWQSGIGYHFSTDAYTRIPSWFEDYQYGLEDFVVSGAKLGKLVVRTVDTSGDEIKGLWIEVRKNGRTLVTGFSPATFSLSEGTHQVIASNYQNYVFAKWQDGSLQPHLDVQVHSDKSAEIAAVFENRQAAVHIESVDLVTGKRIKAMSVQVARDGSVAGEGTTPLRLELPPAVYTLTASSSKYYEFAGWSPNNFGSNTTTFQLKGDTTVTAYYRNSISDALLAAGCLGDRDYKQHVADSILRNGILGGMLELQMRKTLSSISC